jgi:dsRNA-specific ribonuclease
MFQQMEEFIRGVFNKFIPSLYNDKRIIDQYFSPSNMKIWQQAFTHKTFDAQDNYEQLEHEGDRVLSLVFTTYVIDLFNLNKKEISESIITNLKNHYMSKSQQAPLAEKMELTKIVRYRHIKLSTSIAEDVFEAFFGALYRVGNSVIVDTVPKFGKGFVDCYSLITNLFRDVQFSQRHIEGNAVTILQQLFNQLSLGKIQEDVKEEHIGYNTMYSFTIYSNSDSYKFMKDNFNVEIPKVLGTGSNISKKIAKMEAYEKGLEWFRSHNVSNEYIKNLTERKDFEKFGAIYGDVKRKATDNGFQSLEFDYIRIENTQTVVSQLIGISKAGRREILQSLVSDTPYDGKRTVLYQYVGKPEPPRIQRQEEKQETQLPLKKSTITRPIIGSRPSSYQTVADITNNQQSTITTIGSKQAISSQMTPSSSITSTSSIRPIISINRTKSDGSTERPAIISSRPQPVAQETSTLSNQNVPIRKATAEETLSLIRSLKRQ